ncbi:50S ribosomal protein L11 methyltransferase [Desulforhopalus vacuolatus]|uniref:50S ribosomal protein L11 methyltransferase n=1 Tax=Desulforhopalus vacuolatus TaxID=40414 RepID=UPI001965C74E|nr:50S ribosomal protein L11 methyltransferase [Desulforhopalus vacuolatus]MBM9519242.1 50S ribosomal protein L11 methyltransferase [Desulforhopalus vacuolatus]
MEEKKKSWLKVIVDANPALSDALGDFFMGAFSAAVESGAPDEPGWGTVSAWLEQADITEDEREQILSKVRAYLAELESAIGCSGGVVRYEVVEDQDWMANWKKSFAPFSIVDGLVIAPSWEEYKPQEGEQVITMDPGMAFGTGLHDTTSFTMEFIREAVGEGAKTLLDVGTGTGVLGMAGLLFGAERVLGIDNDPEAVRAAVANVETNGLAGKMKVEETPLEEVEGVFDIVAANIIHNVLLSMSSDLVARLAPGGSLVISGILAGRQTENIQRVFSCLGLQQVGERIGKEWVALRFVRV